MINFNNLNNEILGFRKFNSPHEGGERFGGIEDEVNTPNESLVGELSEGSLSEADFEAIEQARLAEAVKAERMKKTGLDGGSSREDISEGIRNAIKAARGEN